MIYHMIPVYDEASTNFNTCYSTQRSTHYTQLIRAESSILTLFSQQVGVEAEVVDTEVQPSLTGHFSLPVAAGVVVHQLFLFGHAEELTKLCYCLFELIGVIIFFDVVAFVVFSYDALNSKTDIERLCLCSPKLLPYEISQNALQLTIFYFVLTILKENEQKLPFCDYLSVPNLNFSLYKSGDVIFILKYRERLQEVLLQPLPVLCDLLTRAPQKT